MLMVFKCSYPTVDLLLEEGADILFTCEHWLKPAELFTVKSICVWI